MFSEFSVRAQQWRDFATAHSCGLRHGNKCCATCGHYLCHSAFVRVATSHNLVICFLALFATAHSCGLRLLHTAVQVRRWSLPQRIRAGCDDTAVGMRLSLLALPQRIRAGCDDQPHDSHVTSNPLPQRIRAGCDDRQ